MSEYYALKRYTTDRFGNQFYATDKNNNNIYLNVGTRDEKYEIFAKTNENKILYAKDCHGHFILPIRDKKPYYFFDNGPVFPINDNNLQVYARFNNCEIYPNDGETDFYLMNSDRDQCYAKNSKGEYYYALKLNNGHHIQFYAKDKHNQDILLYDKNGDVLYPLNLTLNRPIYNVIQNKELYINVNGKDIYGRNLQQLPVYARDNNEEYFATDIQNLPYYANYEHIEFYPKLNNKKQFYRKINEKQIYAFKDKNIQYYAKNEKLEDILACDNNVTYYCQDLKMEIYPQTKDKDQFYKIHENVEIPAKNENNLEYYAQKNTGDFFYPMDFSETN